MIDLHIHSTRSDGTYSPKELLDYAIEKGLTAMALTDHDTVDGIEEILAYAEELQKRGWKYIEKEMKWYKTTQEGNFCFDIHKWQTRLLENQ